MATACLFLAAKVEETPKPIKEVVRVAYLVQHKSEYDNAVKRIHQKVRLQFWFRIRQGRKAQVCRNDLRNTEKKCFKPSVLYYTLSGSTSMSSIRTSTFWIWRENFAKVTKSWKCIIEGPRRWLGILQTTGVETTPIIILDMAITSFLSTSLNATCCSLRTTLCLQFCPRDIAHAAVNLCEGFIISSLLTVFGQVIWFVIFFPAFNIQQVMRCNPQSAFNARASKDAICNEICNQIIDLYDGTNAS